MTSCTGQQPTYNPLHQRKVICAPKSWRSNIYVRVCWTTGALHIMSLLKIPLLLSTTWGVYVMFTPPNPPPSPERRVRPTGFEIIFPYLPPVVKVIATVPQVLEIWANVTCSSPSQGRLYNLGPCRTGCSDLHADLTFTIASLIAFTGALIRLTTYRYLGSMFTFELGRSHRLVTTGPYSVVRHPSYAGGMLSVGGTIVSILSRGSWLRECTGLGETWSVFGWTWGVFAMLVLLVIRRMTIEDNLLREAFGKEWEDWAENVPYKFVPGII
ncbi:hypothetical protein BD779DRAFT_990845 [Infundibulicybe gibba]|nr:hypothetical protein BD779DRAFT_990845 [Infundibulicybe gibba]